MDKLIGIFNIMLQKEDSVIMTLFFLIAYALLMVKINYWLQTEIDVLNDGEFILNGKKDLDATIFKAILPLASAASVTAYMMSMMGTAIHVVAWLLCITVIVCATVLAMYCTLKYVMLMLKGFVREMKCE